MDKQRQISLSDYLEVIVRWRKFIIRNVLIICIAAAIISLILTQKFTATATILPPNIEQEAMFGYMTGLIPGGVTSGFTSMLGGMVPGVSTPSDLYASIMRSSRIKREIIIKYNLKEEFKAKTMHDAFEALEEITKIDISPEGIISVGVTYKDKYLATDIANSYVEELDKFNTETAMTTGKKYRVFIEKRLNENIDSLKQAENNLKSFQEVHRTIALDIEMQSAIEAIAELKSQIILLEVQRAAVGSPRGASNLYRTNIDRQLSELKKQLAKIEFGDTLQNKKQFGAGFAVPFSELPEVSLEFARLLRDVEVQTAIYELLTQQYEQAKIMEAKDTPTVQFLDRAGVPEKRTFPIRTLIVVFTFFASLFANIGLVFLLEYFIDIKSKPGNHPFAVKFLRNLQDDFEEVKLFIKKIFRRSKN